jgi:hypothetical protein
LVERYFYFFIYLNTKFYKYKLERTLGGLTDLLISEGCPRGFYKNVGMLTCQLCPSNQYSYWGSSVCITCPSGKVASKNRIGCGELLSLLPYSKF